MSVSGVDDADGQRVVHNFGLYAIEIHALLKAIGTTCHTIGVVINVSTRTSAPAAAVYIFGKVLGVYACNGALTVIGIEKSSELFGTVGVVVVSLLVVCGTIVGLD